MSHVLHFHRQGGLAVNCTTVLCNLTSSYPAQGIFNLNLNSMKFINRLKKLFTANWSSGLVFNVGGGKL